MADACYDVTVSENLQGGGTQQSVVSICICGGGYQFYDNSLYIGYCTDCNHTDFLKHVDQCCGPVPSHSCNSVPPSECSLIADAQLSSHVCNSYSHCSWVHDASLYHGGKCVSTHGNHYSGINWQYKYVPCNDPVLKTDQHVKGLCNHAMRDTYLALYKEFPNLKRSDVLGSLYWPWALNSNYYSYGADQNLLIQCDIAYYKIKTSLPFCKNVNGQIVASLDLKQQLVSHNTTLYPVVFDYKRHVAASNFVFYLKKAQISDHQQDDDVFHLVAQSHVADRTLCLVHNVDSVEFDLKSYAWAAHSDYISNNAHMAVFRDVTAQNLTFYCAKIKDPFILQSDDNQFIATTDGVYIALHQINDDSGALFAWAWSHTLQNAVRFVFS